MSEPKLTYGLSLQTQRLVSIASVLKGKECGLVCPECEKPLIAKKGKKNQHHFAHYRGEDCPGARMSALHRLAQELLAEHKQVMLPEYNEGKYFHKDATLITFDDVRLEETIQVGDNQRRPDAIGIKDGVEYWIEIYVTHAVDNEKEKDIKALAVNCIEIDLSDLLETWFNEESVTRRLQQDSGSRKWVSSPILDAKAKEAKKEYDESVKRMIEGKKSLICQKIIYGFKNGDVFNVRVKLPTICKKSNSCPLSLYEESCTKYVLETFNLHKYFDNIEEIIEYDGVPANLILRHSQYPSRIILIQIYDSEEQGHHKVGNTHRIIRLRFPRAANVAYFDFQEGFADEMRDRYALHFFNFKPQQKDLPNYKTDDIERSQRIDFQKIILYGSGKFYLQLGGCIQIMQAKKVSIAEYLINPHHQIFGSLYAAAYLARKQGVQLKDCAICKNNIDTRGAIINCIRKRGVLHNEAPQCPYFQEDKALIDKRISHFSDDDFIKIK